MKKERKFKYDYLFLTDLMYVGVLVTPIIATIFCVLFFAHQQYILANTLLIMVAILVIYLFLKLSEIRLKINYTVAEYLINEYLKSSKIYFLKNVLLEFEKNKEIIDFIVITKNGLIFIKVYESYSSSNENSAKFNKETQTILHIERLINELNEEKLKDHPIDYDELPIEYIVTCTNNIIFINKENKEENKEVVRKNAYEIPQVINKFIEKNKVISYNMETISSIYYMFKKKVVNPKKMMKLNEKKNIL